MTKGSLKMKKDINHAFIPFIFEGQSFKMTKKSIPLTFITCRFVWKSSMKYYLQTWGAQNHSGLYLICILYDWLQTSFVLFYHRLSDDALIKLTKYSNACTHVAAGRSGHFNAFSLCSSIICINKHVLRHI